MSIHPETCLLIQQDPVFKIDRDILLALFHLRQQYIINSLAPELCVSNFTNVFFQLILWIDILNISCQIGLR